MKKRRIHKSYQKQSKAVWSAIRAVEKASKELRALPKLTEEPVAFWASEKPGLYVSMTTEDEGGCVIPFRELFIDTMQDVDDAKMYLPLFKDVVKRLEKWIKEEDESRTSS